MAARQPHELTDLQNKFMDALFGECMGDELCAMKTAGYAKGTRWKDIVASLEEEIIARSNQMMALSAPKAVFAMKGLLNDPNAIGAKNTLAVAKEVLDRVGIVKKEKVEVTSDTTAIVILPAKRD